MKDVEMHKILGLISRDLERIREQVKNKSLSDEIYELRRKVLKQMIKIEKGIWEERRKKEGKIL